MHITSQSKAQLRHLWPDVQMSTGFLTFCYAIAPNISVCALAAAASGSRQAFGVMPSRAKQRRACGCLRFYPIRYKLGVPAFHTNVKARL